MPTISEVVVLVFTWPYFWTLRYSTLRPIQALLDACERDQDVGKFICAFRASKHRELQSIKTASTLSAAAAIGALSWKALPLEMWSFLGCAHCSLTLAIFSIILAAQHESVLEQQVEIKHTNTSSNNPDIRNFLKLLFVELGKDSERERARFRKSKNMIYIWQSPLMLMAWSWVWLLLSISLRMIGPFLSTKKTQDLRKASIMYFVIFAVSLANCAWCSFWLFRAASAGSVGGGYQVLMFLPGPQMLRNEGARGNSQGMHFSHVRMSHVATAQWQSQQDPGVPHDRDSE